MPLSPGTVAKPRVEGARFGHVNLTARDWKRLASFYASVFGCSIVPPERNYRGPLLDAATGLDGAHLTGAHLALPGFGYGGRGGAHALSF